MNNTLQHEIGLKSPTVIGVCTLSKFTTQMRGHDLRLLPVSWNSENIQNLNILHDFIKASSFPLYTNLYLLLRFANLQHK